MTIPAIEYTGNRPCIPAAAMAELRRRCYENNVARPFGIYPEDIKIIRPYTEEELRKPLPEYRRFLHEPIPFPEPYKKLLGKR